MLLRFLHRALKARFRDQRAELKALLVAIQPGDIAVDVGANKGSYLWWLSRAVRSGKVVAFEPQPRLASYLSEVCRSARLRNVVVERAGVSDRSGHLTLHIPGEGDSPGASFEHSVTAQTPCRDISVAVVRLDDYFQGEQRRISAIKVDVEGHELSVFRGAERILHAHHPVLVFECEERHTARGGVREVLAFLKQQGYDGVFINGDQLVPVAEFDPAVQQKQDGDRFWDAEGYCNNFIMRPVA